MSTVIFLDIDGVLHPAESPGSDAALYGHTFQPEQLKLLNEIYNCLDSPVQIVLTSNWRKNEHSLSTVNQVLITSGIESGLSGVTDVLKGKERQAEICHYLRNYDPRKFVIIDDLDLADVVPVHSSSRYGLWGTGSYVDISEHCVCTDYRTGLNRESTDKAIDILRTREWGGENFY
jgi:hypothetical protein